MLSDSHPLLLARAHRCVHVWRLIHRRHRRPAQAADELPLPGAALSAVLRAAMHQVFSPGGDDVLLAAQPAAAALLHLADGRWLHAVRAALAASHRWAQRAPRLLAPLHVIRDDGGRRAHLCGRLLCGPGRGDRGQPAPLLARHLRQRALRAPHVPHMQHPPAGALEALRHLQSLRRALRPPLPVAQLVRRRAQLPLLSSIPRVPFV